MIHVSVAFLGLLRDQVGARTIDLELSHTATYRDLLDALAPLVGEKLGEWAWDRDEKEFTKRVVVSRGSSIATWDGQSKLIDGEEIVVFPPVAGG